MVQSVQRKVERQQQQKKRAPLRTVRHMPDTADVRELLKPMSTSIQRRETQSALSDMEGQDTFVDIQQDIATIEQATAAGANIEQLARQVYDRIRRRLLIDAERLGNTRHRL